MFKGKLLLIVVAFVAVMLMSANALAVLVDNFESYSTGLVGTVASPPWTVSASVLNGPASVAAIASDSGQQYLSYGVPLALTADETFGVSRALIAPILKTSTAETLHLRFYADPANANDSFGLTSAITPGANNFNDFNLQLACRNGKFDVRNGGAWIETAYNANTWYDVWAVVNNSANTFDVYMAPTGQVPTLIATGAKFRNNSTGSLLYFDALVQGAASAPNNSYTVRLDEIYATPEPATIALLGLGALALVRRKKK